MKKSKRRTSRWNSSKVRKIEYKSAPNRPDRQFKFIFSSSLIRENNDVVCNGPLLPNAGDAAARACHTGARCGV